MYAIIVQGMPLHNVDRVRPQPLGLSHVGGISVNHFSKPSKMIFKRTFVLAIDFLKDLLYVTIRYSLLFFSGTFATSETLSGFMI